MNTSVNRPMRPTLVRILSVALLATTVAAAKDAAKDAAMADPVHGPKVGEKAPPVALKDLQGNAVDLSEMAKQSPVVVIFLRGYPGYQCPICTKQVAAFMAAAGKFKQAGAQVLMIYPGPADGLKAHADDFVKGKTLPAGFDMVIDPDYTAVNAWGLRWEADHETAYPSTYVVGKDAVIVFAQSSTGHGDRSKVADVLAAIPK